MIEVDFSEYARVYIDIKIKPQDDIVLSPVVFKVDTGADTTTISKLSLEKLGYNMDWIRQNTVIFDEKDKPTTASGEKISAGYVQLPLINILGYEGKYWPFQIIIEEKQDFRNLLGRDLLSGFNYSFNNDSNKFTITRAESFKILYKFLPRQEISELIVST
jgi:predicted aspartyl protease